MKKILLFLSFLLMSIGVWSATATLPVNYSFDDGKNSLQTGVTQSGLGTDYAESNAPYRLKFDNDGDYIQIEVDCAAEIITIEIKEFTSDKGASVQIQGSVNGSSFTEIQTFSVSKGQNKISSLSTNSTISSSYKYFRIKRNARGNFGLGVLQITKAAPTYTITAQSNDISYGTVSLSGNVITGSPKSGYRYASPAYTVTSGTATVSQSGNIFTVTAESDCEITINFEAIPTYTVTYNLNGGTGTIPTETPKVEDETFTLHDGTTGIEPPTGKEFSKWNDGINNYKGGASYTMPGNNITLTAQWKDKLVVDGMKFILLSDISDLEDGDSIIIVNGDSITMSIEQASNNRRSTTKFNYDERNNIITLTDESDSVQIIRITKIDDYWGLETDSGYLYAAGNGKSSNYLRTQETNDANGYWDITINEECIASVVAQGANSNNTMQYNQNKGGKNGPLFSCYSSASQSPIKIYKKIKDLYTVVFKNNGVAIDTIYTIKHLSTIPSVSSNTLRCQKSGVFVGWSAHDIITTDTVPDDLFQTIKGSPIIESDKTFYAVFADETPRQSHPNNFILTIDKNDFTGGHGYNSCNGEKISIATSTDGKDTVHIVWTSNKIYKNADAMQWKADSGMIYNNTSLGVITSFSLIEKEDNQGTYTINFGSTEQPTGNPIVGNSYFKTTIGDKYGLTKSITINFTKDVTPKIYSNYTTYCIDTLQSGGNWSESGKWKHGRIPEFNEAAVLLDSAIVNIPHAVAKYIIIDKSSTNTGNLTIGANQGLEVQDTISVYNGTTYNSTTPEDLILQSSEAGNASLIFNNKNNNQATVCLYSKSKIVGNTWHWQYMGTAMTSLNALYNYYGSWVYEWVKNTGWVAVTNGATMSAWKGYCITQENERGEWYATTGTLVKTDELDTTLTVPVGKDMVFANSWTAPIHISKLVESGFVMNPMNVYLFNAGSAPNGSKQGTDAGTHIVIPVHAVPYLKDTLIAPQQGFFVSNINGTIEGSIHLDYKKLVRGSDSIVAGPMRAPKRNAEVLDKPDVMKIYANGISYGDNVVILEREDFSTGFDNGWDGNKSSFGVNAPSIYVINTDGTYDAVSSIPSYEGIMLGFRSGIDSIYTITFEYDGENEWYLNDLTTLTSTLIGSDSKYTFTHGSENDVRFIISATPYADIATDIDNINNANKIHKYLHNGNLYIMKNNRIFNAIGNLIQ